MNNWLSSIRHMFKLDPNKPISKEQIKKLCDSGTDSIVVGGTLDITYDDTRNLLRMIRACSSNIPIIQEISEFNAIVPGFDYYFVPLVLNAQKPEWILNVHHRALKEYGELVNWDQVIVEGYVVLNPEASVANLTMSNTELSIDDVIAYARMADQMLHLPILYIEYSGVYGNVEWVKEMKDTIVHSRLFYGGGIDSLTKAKEISRYADTIIVGNLIYQDFEQALKTVEI